ncbi:MAG: carboxypeptidase M32 [Verrucomicrobiales bacterium]|nr:carboxypeptidase M32 [Verrucomicrobiales bacterium]
MSEAAYLKLVELGREVQLVADTQALLSWDQEVLMPSKSLEYRGEQMAWFSGWIHEQNTKPEVGEWIEEAESQCSGDSDEVAKANLREWKHSFERETKLPRRLVEEFALAQVHAKSAWAEARAKSEFSIFAPHLTKLVSLCKEQAECWGYLETPYDGLLDKFERGASTVRLTETLGDLRTSLIPIVEEATSNEPFDRSCLEGQYPIEKQKAFNHEVAAAMGFDFDAGRIDTAVHPFCSGMAPHDTRLTTRYDESDFLSSLFGVLHEAGHGLYEQGLTVEHRGQPVGNAVSLGIHESQSRLWENHVGRSRAFWDRWLPVAAGYFPHLASVDVDTMYRAVNQASLSYIRVESDEVTYDLHVLLRFEIEKLIFSDQLKIDEIPEAWNSRFESYFGLTVEDDANGCLQDIHWSLGIFGYFPTYSLGNINAAHLASEARSNSVVKSDMDAGEYSSLLNWMRSKIHGRGSILMPDDLVIEATGRPANPTALVHHLRDRYLTKS